ncbi:MAG: hypothetical protein CBB82_05935 [Betaproteobacteria bacterium TMED22]|nr:MAG: hypothetical protein CBB82_05935 [Betaproteobacteria bacterium TMED22]
MFLTLPVFNTKITLTLTCMLWSQCINSVSAEERYFPGDEFKDCGDCPVMIVIPSGSFSMGSPPVDQGRPYAEGELRLVHIPNRFASGKFEITYKEWEGCVVDGQCPDAKKDDWSGETHPVVNISWKEAFQYTKWLSKKTGRPYRLLTEAEWEYVATGGISRARFFGIKAQRICDFGNIYDYTAEEVLDYGLDVLPCNDQYGFSAPIGSFKPNQFGVHDMLGNVWEWTEDCQAILWRNAPTDASARVDGHCTHRAYRGGSWLSHPPKYLQIPDRYKYLGAREIDLGFRLALTLNP